MPKKIYYQSLTLLFCFLLKGLCGQETFPSNEAGFQVMGTYVFKNAVIHTDYQTTLNNAILIIEKNLIKKVTTSIEDIPKQAVVFDLKGKHIYPSFIDLYSDFGIPEIKKQTPLGSYKENYIKGAYAWNPAIKADFNAAQNFVFNKEKADEYRKNGIGIVLTSLKDGIVRGSGAAIVLSNEPEHNIIIKDKSAGFFSFKKGSSPHYYPSSLMGSIALLRQTFYDAIWYHTQKSEFNISLKAFNELLSLPIIFECSDKWDIFRANNISKEFKQSFLYKTNGDEYQRINELKQLGIKLIVPLNFPEPYDVSDPFDADIISLADLKHWEMAPSNPAFLEKNDVDFSFTTYGLKDKNQFLDNIRKAVQYGLSEKTALKALTYNPAKFLSLENTIGSIKENYIADFFISDKNIFDKNAVIVEHWTNGKANFYYPKNIDKLFGTYEVIINNVKYSLMITGNYKEQKIKIKQDTITIKSNAKIEFPNIKFNTIDSVKNITFFGLFNTEDTTITGKLEDLKSHLFQNIVFRKVKPITDTASYKPSEKITDFGKIYYPFSAYGKALQDDQTVFEKAWSTFKNRYQAILIKDATVWTNTKDSILQEYDVYIVEGKIVRIAPNIDTPKLAFAKIINAKGWHLTPGIIDEHSHIAISGGVNEWTQASSAEVRIGDVINPEDINIYRQLAGGVTTAQILHGSANPIGGQCQVIKLRWGYNAEEMKYSKATPSIKFALGENVKQGNSPISDKFPQSRMGVEQVFNDYFHRAKKYQNTWKQYLALSSKEKKNTPEPRKDLELDALVEILEGKRDITCHSYIQSEINMLLHIADSLGFKINTFTHVLEGYKVADKLKKYGANASTFSDWWAYKLEVMDAIPYNAALLTKMGINTCINSDDAEMGRRLNQEAGKCIKYGGLTLVQALKLVTLNPAKALHIEKEVGSIEVGKVADVVLWSDMPLSVTAKVMYNIIDGQIFYDDDTNKKLEEQIIQERTRIIQKLLQEKKAGIETQKYIPHHKHNYHCEDIE